MGAAMIAAVPMGLSVDSSIHYVIAFRRARLAGLGVAATLSEVQRSNGCHYFHCGVNHRFSDFSLCDEFCASHLLTGLVSLAMLGGLVGNLVLLPLLLELVSREND